MKKFIINVSTNWCGMDQEYAAIAEEESDLYDLTDQLAYDNFSDYGCEDYIADELFEKEFSELTDEEREEYDQLEPNYYSSFIEEVDENDEDQLELFNSLDLVYDGEKRQGTQDSVPASGD